MGRDLPAIHGPDHAWFGPDPLVYPIQVTSDDGSVAIVWPDERTVDLSVVQPYVPPNSLETFTGVPESVSNGGSQDLRFVFNVGSALVDLTNDRVPKPVADGIYAVTVNVTIDALTVGGYWGLQLSLDAATSSIQYGKRLHITETDCTITVVGYIPSTHEIRCHIGNQDGVSARTFEMYAGNIARVT
jgi:hypothetical protein